MLPPGKKITMKQASGPKPARARSHSHKHCMDLRRDQLPASATSLQRSGFYAIYLCMGSLCCIRGCGIIYANNIVGWTAVDVETLSRSTIHLSSIPTCR